MYSLNRGVYCIVSLGMILQESRGSRAVWLEVKPTKNASGSVPEVWLWAKVSTPARAVPLVAGHCHLQKRAKNKAAVSTSGALAKGVARRAPRTKWQAHLCEPSATWQASAGAAQRGRASLVAVQEVVSHAFGKACAPS